MLQYPQMIPQIEPHVYTCGCHGSSVKGIVRPRAYIYMFQHGPVVLYLI